MYRLVLYGLALLSTLAIVLSFAGDLYQSGLSLIFSALILLVTCQTSNKLLAWLFKTAANTESSLITALILFLILPPAQTTSGSWILILAAALAMSSKYLLAILEKHLFNPAAVSVLILSLLGISRASWWIGIGNWILIGATLFLGLLIVKKIRRFSMFFAFLASASAVIFFVAHSGDYPITKLLWELSFLWPTIFFASIMFTEPFTTPPSGRLQVAYGVMVGLLFGWPFKIGFLYSSPELALVAGNLFSYIVSPKYKLRLKLKERLEVGRNIFEFIFLPNKAFSFVPGQYLEWTLPHPRPDSRGNRRYFTVASSPTEQDVRIGVKIPMKASSFKTALRAMRPGANLVATQLAGDFILPKNLDKKIIGIAGGIGITPFRSMVKAMLDREEKRDFVIFYTCAHPSEFVFGKIFKKAKPLGVRLKYVITDPENTPQKWDGHTGFLNSEIISTDCPDFLDRKFFLSGPNTMVDTYRRVLKKMGVSGWNIITDYFPGY